MLSPPSGFFNVVGSSYPPRMPRERTYSDQALARAIGNSSSWRGVMRELGLTATSSGAIRSVRSHADSLGIDHGHFRGQRRWTESELRTAVARADSWVAVAEVLGLEVGPQLSAAKGHAMRLGIDVSHLIECVSRDENLPVPDIARLSRAGPMMAAAWFTLIGCDVSWPLEPCRYDLLVLRDGSVRRVQVRTSTARQRDSWKVYISTSGRERQPYEPGEIDEFFIIDGGLRYYLIPYSVVGGLQAIHMSNYSSYAVKRDPI